MKSAEARTTAIVAVKNGGTAERRQIRLTRSADAGLGFDSRGDIGRQILRPSQCVANPRDFQLSRRDLTCWLPALLCGPERPFMAGEHATKDRRGTLLRLRVRAAETDEPFRAVLTGRQRAEMRAHVPQAA